MFARNTEKVTKAFLEALVAQGGSESTQFDLPHWTRDLDRLVDEIAKGKNEESLDRLRDYLSDLSSWLMACLTGYQQAAPQWSVDFLDRSSPKSIEKGAKLPDWKKHLGLASSELWERYNEMIQDLTPGLVEDEVRDIAAKIAKEHYRNLKGKSKRRSK